MENNFNLDEFEELTSQKAQILDHLKKGYKISAKTARNLFGCFTLAQRIKNLRDEGYVITHNTVIRRTPEGKYIGYYFEYKLAL